METILTATIDPKENQYIQTSTTNYNSSQKKTIFSGTRYIYIEKPKRPEPVRKSKRLPFAKQTEKLGGVPYQTNNNKKKNINNLNFLQEKTTTTMDRNEEETTVQYGRMTQKSDQYGPTEGTNKLPRGGCDMLPS